MSKKLSIDFIRTKLADKGLILSSDVYINCDSPLDFVCSNGHQHRISWNSFRRGRGCAQCAGNAKLTIDFVRSGFKSRGWDLNTNTNTYINSQTLLEFICSDGHQHQISWAGFQQGGGCIYCVGNAKLTIDFVRSGFKSRGWDLNTNTYINSHLPLDFICDNGHQHQISWKNLQNNVGCGQCIAGGLNLLNPAVFYYARITANGFDKPFYKVGITNKDDVNDRLKQLNATYEIVDTVKFTIGYEAYKFEQDILNRFNDRKVDPKVAKMILPNSGHTELFDCDILNADSDFLDGNDRYQ